MKSIILTICVITLAIVSSFGQGYTKTSEALPLSVPIREMKIDPNNYGMGAEQQLRERQQREQQIRDEERSLERRRSLSGFDPLLTVPPTPTVQNYGTIVYMGKTIFITAEFFELFNTMYSKHNLRSESLKIYYATVDLLKSKSTVFKIDEAKRISYTSTVEFPYWNDTPDKKSPELKSGIHNFNYIFNKILGPLVINFVSGK